MMKNIKYFLLIMVATFMSVSSVNAEVNNDNYIVKMINRSGSDYPFTTWYTAGENVTYPNSNYVEFPYDSVTSPDSLPHYLYTIYCGTGSLALNTISSSSSKGTITYNGNVGGGACEVNYGGNTYKGTYYLVRWLLDYSYYTSSLGVNVYGVNWSINLHNTYNYPVYVRFETIFVSNEMINDFASDYLLRQILNQNSDLRNELNTIKSSTNETNNKLDETNQELGDLNNSMTSESEDFDDSSCGVICKLGKIPVKIIDGIINGIKSLFIPEDGYFENWFNDLKLFFEEKLGFLAAPFTIFIDFVNMYLNLDADTDIIINIPDIYVPNFEEYKIISATTFNWSELLKSKESLNTLWQLYLAFVDVFLILNFINLCESKYNAIFGGNNSNYEYYTVEDSITYDNDTGEVTGRRMNERRTTRKKV